MFIIVEKGIPKFKLGERVNGVILTYWKRYSQTEPLYPDKTLVYEHVAYRISGDDQKGMFFFITGSPVFGFYAVVVSHDCPGSIPQVERISLADDGTYSIGDAHSQAPDRHFQQSEIPSLCDHTLQYSLCLQAYIGAVGQ